MDRYRGATAERHEQQFVGPRTGVAAAGLDRFVGVERVAAVQPNAPLPVEATTTVPAERTLQTL